MIASWIPFEERVRGSLALAPQPPAGSTALVALAVAQGWLGPDVGRGSELCERARGGTTRDIWHGLVAWHLLGAVAAYWLYRFYASELYASELISS
jgi:hypothetical protein